MENNMTNKTYTVQEFIKKYNSFTSEKAKETFLKSVIKNNYVDFLVKKQRAALIITTSCINEKTQRVKIDSSKQYLLYNYTVFDLYTNIRMDIEHLHVDYDLLEKHDLVAMILKFIPKAELNKFDTVLNMCQEDFLTNSFNIQNYLDMKIDQLTLVLLEMVKPVIERTELALNSINPEVLQNLVKQLEK